MLVSMEYYQKHYQFTLDDCGTLSVPLSRKTIYSKEDKIDFEEVIILQKKEQFQKSNQKITDAYGIVFELNSDIDNETIILHILHDLIVVQNKSNQPYQIKHQQSGLFMKLIGIRDN